MQLGLISKLSSFSKLIRMICVILSFQIGSNWVAIGLFQSLRIVCYAVIGLVQKSAFSNWSYNGFKLSVTIRLEKVMRCAQITIAYLAGVSCVSSIQSCFSQVSVLVNPYRAAIEIICGTHLYILCFGLISISYAVHKRINPSGPIRISLIRGFIATE
jgi:hypothetical protein